MLDRFLGSLAVLTLSNLMLPAQDSKPIPLPKPAEKATQKAVTTRPIVRNWRLADLGGLLGAGLEGARNYDNGRTCLRQATCLECHQFKGEGSPAGPDLSAIARQYGPEELLMHIVEPDREIREPFLQQEVLMKDGSKLRGRIVKQTADTVIINTRMTEVKAIRSIDRKLIKSMAPSKNSLMPSGLIDTLHENEILDLLAYLLSKGDREDPMFK